MRSTYHSDKFIQRAGCLYKSGLGSQQTLRLISPHLNSPLTSPSPFSINFHLINEMPSKPKTARREHSSETIAIVVALHEVHYSYAEIARQVRLARSTVVTIVHRAKRQADASSVPKKRTGRPTKLNVRARRALIRHVEKNPHDNLLALTTPSKSGQKLSRVTVRNI